MTEPADIHLPTVWVPRRYIASYRTIIPVRGCGKVSFSPSFISFAPVTVISVSVCYLSVS